MNEMVAQGDSSGDGMLSSPLRLERLKLDGSCKHPNATKSYNMPVEPMEAECSMLYSYETSRPSSRSQSRVFMRASSK